MNEDSLVNLLKERFGPVKKVSGGWVMIRCPTCTARDAAKRRRGVHLQNLVTNCFICGEHITVRDLLHLEKIERVTDQAVEVTPEHPQARIIPCDGVIPVNELSKDHPAIKLLAKDHLHDYERYWNENYIGYIPPETAHDIIFKHDGRVDTKLSVADSLIFPVFYQSELVGWQCRYIPGTPNGDRMTKIRYLHIFKKGDHLYNYDNVVKHQMVVVVEGVKKSLKFPNGVATFGKCITENQIQKLLHWKKIVFMYDGEEITQAKTKQLVGEINAGSTKCINIDPRDYGYDSPDDMPEEIAQKIVFKEWKAKIKDNE